MIRKDYKGNIKIDSGSIYDYFTKNFACNTAVFVPYRIVYRY